MCQRELPNNEICIENSMHNSFKHLIAFYLALYARKNTSGENTKELQWEKISFDKKKLLKEK